ncbi:MAG: hypothetical protein GTO14_12120 [Anaerolineales bacterium]|nr:hypothetical protein [Anaerolineales bacterium]
MFAYKVHPGWSRRAWIVTIAVAVCVLTLYVYIGPGEDYYGAYTLMVTKPGHLPQVAEHPWTLNPTWMVPFMAPFVSLPGRAGYVVFMAFSIAMIILGAYTFGGKAIPILLSAHMLWILWWGQLEGWGVLGLVLAWYANKKQSWFWMFLAMAIAAFKPQVSFVPVLALWWWMGKDRWKSLAALVGLFIASIIIWGPWPLWYLGGIIKFIDSQHYGVWNASLGWVALPLFIPALRVPLDRQKRLIALTATSYLVIQYMPYYSTIPLFCFALPLWAYAFSFLGYLPNVVGTRIAWNGLVFLPITVLLWVYWPHLIRVWESLRSEKRDPASVEGPEGA